MEDKFFDKILEQIIDESIPAYLEKEQSTNKELDEDIKFSDTHIVKMNKLFKEVKRIEQRRKMVHLTKKFAIVILCIAVAFTCLVGSVEAWRKEVVKFIMKNNSDNYMSISFGETNENQDPLRENSGDINNTNDKTYTFDDIQFLYIPEGFEYVKNWNTLKFKLYNFMKNEKFIRLKKEDILDVCKFVDIEEVSSETLVFEDKEVFKVEKNNNRIGYVWYDDVNIYNVYSNIENEDEILKFIENIKVLKKI